MMSDEYDYKARKNTDEYRSNYEAAFGSEKAQRGSWIWDATTGELVEKSSYTPQDNSPCAPAVHGSLDAFVSPVDGSIIDDRGKLREHNKRHGVTNVADYGEGYFERRGKEKFADQQGATKEAKMERVNAIKKAMYDNGLGY